MTHKNQGADEQGVTQPPTDESASSAPSDTAPSETTPDSLGTTLESPQAQPDPEQTAPADTSADTPADTPVAPAEEPTVEEPTAEAAATEEPTAEEPTAEANDLAAAVADEPAAESPAVTAATVAADAVAADAVAADAVADDAVASAEGSETPASASEGVQSTAVMPQVPAIETPIPVDAPAPDLIPPPLAEAEASRESDGTQGDTAESTLTDITLSESGGNRFALWLASLKGKLARGDKPESESGKTESAKTRWWRLRPWQWALIGAASLVFLFAVFVTVDAGLYYGKVHHGISVVGQDLSRMAGDEATQTLTGLVDEAQKQPITLTSDAQTWDVLPGDLGTSIDVDAAVAKAMALTREGNVVTDLGKKIALYFNSEDLPLEGTIDESKMDGLITTVSTKLDVPAVNATLRVVDGDIQIVDAQQGKVVDKEALRASLTGLLLSLHSTELPVPMVVDSPDLEAVDIEGALAQARVMISTDVVLTYQGETLATLTPAELVTYLEVAPPAEGQDTKTVPVFSAEKMTAFFDTVDPKVGTPAKNATFEMNLEVEEPYPLVMVEGVNGEGLDREATAAALTKAAANATGRTAKVVLKTVEPERTTADLKAMGIKDLLGDYKTSPFVGSKNRQSNVRLATKLCSGVFLAPGEEFNTDERLGVRSEANGWATAPGIVGGGKLEDVLGGGICQVSTTLFNAVLLAGLEITERHNHSIFINHYPDGRDATVTSGGKNMRFRNDTDHYILIYGWSTGINTRFWIWGVNDGRKVLPIKFSGYSIGGAFPTTTVINASLPIGATKEVVEGQRSRSCNIERTVTYADGTTKTQSWSSRWNEMAKVIETNPAPVTPSTDAPPSTAASPTTTAP